MQKRTAMPMHQSDISVQHDQKGGSFRDLELFKVLLQPHFLFNSLNNLYALAVKRSELTTEAIAGLSDLLAKVVNCCREEYITLDQEVDLIRDYVMLERIWLGEINFCYDIKVTGNTENFMIPPLVLYTFIENCFKHGIRKCQGDGWLKVEIEVKEGGLYFSAKNRIPQCDGYEEREQVIRSGLGNVAVRKLLQKKCTGKYRLHATRSRESYRVDLHIKTDKDREIHQ